MHEPVLFSIKVLLMTIILTSVHRFFTVKAKWKLMPVLIRAIIASVFLVFILDSLNNFMDILMGKILKY